MSPVRVALPTGLSPQPATLDSWPNRPILYIPYIAYILLIIHAYLWYIYIIFIISFTCSGSTSDRSVTPTSVFRQFAKSAGANASPCVCSAFSKAARLRVPPKEGGGGGDVRGAPTHTRPLNMFRSALCYNAITPVVNADENMPLFVRQHAFLTLARAASKAARLRVPPGGGGHVMGKGVTQWWY